MGLLRRLDRLDPPAELASPIQYRRHMLPGDVHRNVSRSNLHSRYEAELAPLDGNEEECSLWRM
jgi:hypothetical protein